MNIQPKHLTITGLLAVALTCGATDVTNLKAGRLKDAGIDPTEQTLNVSGHMDASDFFYIFDTLGALQSLDISTVTIDAYQGAALPYTGLTSSPANTLPDYCLTGLTSLKSLRLPSGLKSIGRGALSGSGITSLSIPYGVTSVGDYAMMRCPELTSVEIPASVTRLGTRAFAYCPKLANVEIAAGVASVSDGLFEACGGLNILDLSRLTSCTSIGQWAIAECSGLEVLLLPANSNAIEKGALYGDSGISALVLPESTAYIGDNAMSAMSALTTLNASEVASVPELGQNVWSRLDQNKITLVTPNGQTESYKQAQQWQDCNIVALDDWKSSTNNVSTAIGNTGMHVCIADGVLKVTAKDGTLGSVAVFNAAGTRIDAASADSAVSFNAIGWAKGVYLVVSEIGVAKIAI